MKGRSVNIVSRYSCLMLEVAVSAYNVVETLGSTETSRSHANNEDIDVTGEEQKSVNSVVQQESISQS